MILDIPTGDEFRESGVASLNDAWDLAIDLLLDILESDVTEWDEDGSIADDYWVRAQRPLSVAVTLAQQGTEFLLKARIAEVSPFLLLSGTVRDWPRGSEQSACTYAEFRTIDAQDLVRVHDTVCAVRLSGAFKEHFERMRKVRNSLVHTVSKAHRFAAPEVLRWVLQVYQELVAGKSWMSHRREYLDVSHPGGAFPSEYGYENRVARELRVVIDSFGAAELKALFGIIKKQRFYYCARCHIRDFGYDHHVKTAQLRPNTSVSTTLYCYACESDSLVRRVRCAKCPGNVIDDDSGTCMSCGEDLEEAEEGRGRSDA